MWNVRITTGKVTQALLADECSFCLPCREQILPRSPDQLSQPERIKKIKFKKSSESQLVQADWREETRRWMWMTTMLYCFDNKKSKNLNPAKTTIQYQRSIWCRKIINQLTSFCNYNRQPPKMLYKKQTTKNKKQKTKNKKQKTKNKNQKTKQNKLGNRTGFYKPF